jgi:hypothetical protein
MEADDERVSLLRLRLSTATRSGIGAGVTSKVETTPRWSDGQGSTAMSVFGLPPSPTTLLAVAVAGPAESTQSIRSCTSTFSPSGEPGVHVKPGRATGFG